MIQMKTYKAPSLTTIPNALSRIQSSTIKIEQKVAENADPTRLATTAAYEADE
jgi:hypothetical protein